MRIGIDARFLTYPQAGGFKTYTSNLVRALPVVDQRHTYIYYVDRVPPPDLPIPRGPNVTIRVVPGSLPLVGMPWREQLALRRAAGRDRLDLFHAPCLTAPLSLPCPSIVTIHDMIWATSPAPGKSGTSTKRRVMQAYYRLVPRLAARRAARVITVSNAAKSDIVRELGIAQELVSVTYPGFNAGSAPADREAVRAELAARRSITSPYVLALGSADPRKNLPALLKAYAALPVELRDCYDLVLVWAHPRLAEATAADAARLGLRDHVRSLTDVSDLELAQLYSAASVFVFPSLYEGFGLPPLEAMARGAPVLASDNSSIPEIVGDAAVLVDSRNPSALGAGLAGLLSNPELRRILRSRGIRRAEKFSWSSCAMETVAVYERALPAPIQGASGTAQSAVC